MLPHHQEGIYFCSKAQDKIDRQPVQAAESSQWSHKRPPRSEGPHAATSVLRPRCSVRTLVRQATEPGSSQRDGVQEKRLKAIGIDEERIRNVVSKVIGCGPGWNPSEAVRFSAVPDSAKKQVQPSVQRGGLLQVESRLTQKNTELTKVTPQSRLHHTTFPGEENT